MLYYLFDYLDKEFNFIGAGVFRYISFRAGAAIALSLVIATVYGYRIIDYLRIQQVGESIRDLGLAGQMQKKGTPTMGGVIIIASIIIPVLLFAKFNVYIILLLISTLWMGLIGFLDDYVKVFKKESAFPWLASDRGVKGIVKIIGQIGLGLIVGLTLSFHPDVVIREFGEVSHAVIQPKQDPFSMQPAETREVIDIHSNRTTVPFFKNNELDYHSLIPFLPKDWTWMLYTLVAVFIVTAVSNGANITDGIDGLAAGSSAIIGLTFAILAYVSGNVIFSDYLNIMYIPNSGELVIFCAAFVGACVGFLWYNSFPAQVFMGDTGSLSLGGVIAVLALSLRKELMIVFICGVFLIESVSVIAQVYYFKYQKRKNGIEYARANRLFLMAPLHHHYQKKGYHEAKIVMRFWIIGILLAVFSLATLKLR